MFKNTIVRYAVFAVCFLALVATFLYLPHTKARADQRPHGTLGCTWTAVTTFTSGSRNGQQTTSTFAFNSDGTLTETSGSLTGTGTWSLTGNKDQAQYTFTENEGRGYVQATDSVSLDPNGKTYQASGSAAFYISGTAIPGTSNTSTTSATFVTC